MKLLGSNLVTLPGLILLAAGILVTAYFGFTSLEVLLVAALILCLIAYFWARRSLRKIQVATEDEDCCAFPGEILSANAKLTNAKFLPVIWLKAVFPTGGDGCICAVDDDDMPVPVQEGTAPELSEHFLWVMPHQSIQWSQRAWAVHRGVCKIGSMCLVSGDGFGLTEQMRETALPAGFRFIVYPAVKPVNVSVLLSRMREMEASSRGFYSDNTLISSIRDYRDGDSFKDINWRLLARQGKVQVNVHEKLAMQRVCFIPDLESFSYLERVENGVQNEMLSLVRRDELEHMLSLVASAIVAIHESGVLCTLVIPAFEGTAPRIVTPEGRETQVMELLTALAEITYAGGETRYPVEDMSAGCHNLGQFFLFTRALPKQEHALSAGLDGLPLFTIVQQNDGEAVDRNTIYETELMSV